MSDLVERCRRYAKVIAGITVVPDDWQPGQDHREVREPCATLNEAADLIEKQSIQLVNVKAALNKSDLWVDRVQNALALLTDDDDRAKLRALASEFNAAIDSTLSDDQQTSE